MSLRRGMLACLAAVTAMLGAAGTASAATITVETTADATVVDATCSLREAIQTANTNALVDDCEMGQASPATDTILVPPGTITLSMGQLTLDPSGANGDVTLQGAGAAVTIIDADVASRVLTVTGSAETITISALTLKNGKSVNNGGGILATSSVELAGARVVQNEAAISGGGIALSLGATLTTSGPAQINGNHAGFQGGGVNLANGAGDIVIGPGATVDGNSTVGLGGGLAANSGEANTDITVTGASVSGNVARQGGGIYFVGGGAAGGDVTLSDATLDGNRLDASSTGSEAGAGMNVLNGDALTISDSTISNNRIEIPSDSSGGDSFVGAGLAATMANVEIVRSEIIENSISVPDDGDHAWGGGIAMPGLAGAVKMDATTVANNTLESAVPSPGGTFWGGGAYLREPGPGKPAIDVRNSTISGNSAGPYTNSTGGAFLLFGSAGPVNLFLTYSTVAGNVGAQFSAIDVGGGGGGAYILNRSIIDNGPGACDASSSGNDGFNADAGTSCVGPGDDTDFENVDANLGPLADNGGPTRTHMLLGPPTLIDAAASPCNDLDGNPVTTDQRGFSRPAGPGCDIGSVEVTVPAPPTLSGFNPASPAEDNNPELLGSAPGGTTVAVYANGACSGAPATTAPAAQLASPGMTVSVPEDVATTFSATATNADGTSACSAAVTYVEKAAVPPPAPRCAGVKATRSGGPGPDVLVGTAKRDVFAGLGGNDTIRGLGGNDLVCGGAGNDTALGGAGNDVLRGEGGRDVLKGAAGKDRLLGGKGRDALTGGRGRDTLKAAAGRRELCNGGPGRDVFRGCERFRGRP